MTYICSIIPTKSMSYLMP